MEVEMHSEITDFLRQIYGLTCHSITPIDGGWMNRLWKVSSDQGELLLKQYSTKRYRQKQLALIEYALQRQILLEQAQIPCPHILQAKGRILHYHGETPSMVMSFCAGRKETSDTISLSQMESLGEACALMHLAFSRLPLTEVRGFPPENKKMLSSLWENYQTRRQNLTTHEPDGYRQALLAQEPILRELSPDFFLELPMGIAHEDFTPDNLLFCEKEVSAIIDFDRNQYSFVWHDVGRALLSFALEERLPGIPEQLNRDKIHAFLRGYNQVLPLTMKDVADAFRITWCIEILWWVMPSCFTMTKSKATRYRDEILWLTKHWFEIDGLLKNRKAKAPSQPPSGTSQ